ncbi:hypothetical protein FQN50_002433 [Emmonsiellopsis sp. PD_5]|nr:hypothetical protein FQN50_002433 [Emmonsiellopsis sp. PD_5]
MDPQQPTSRALHVTKSTTARINTNVTQLLQRFENIMATATIRAAEDLLSLTRTMKETWLFGKLETLGEDERDVQRREGLERDALAVKEAIEKGAGLKGEGEGGG